MYSYKKPEYIEVQCISNKCGYYSSLKIGKWYRAVDTDEKYYKILDGDATTVIWQIRNYSTYKKHLFRTKDVRRDQKLNKILII